MKLNKSSPLVGGPVVLACGRVIVPILSSLRSVREIQSRVDEMFPQLTEHGGFCGELELYKAIYDIRLIAEQNRWKEFMIVAPEIDPRLGSGCLGRMYHSALFRDEGTWMLMTPRSEGHRVTEFYLVDPNKPRISAVP